MISSYGGGAGINCHGVVTLKRTISATKGRPGFGKTGDIFGWEEDLAPKQGDLT